MEGNDIDSFRAQLADILNGEVPDGLYTLDARQIDQFCRNAETEGVTSLLRYKLNQSGALEQCDSVFQETLRGMDMGQRARQLVRDKENLRIFRLLHQAGLEFIILKGDAIARQYYQQSHHRNRCDCDLLFASKPVTHQVWSLLSGQGYEKSFALEGELVGLQFECGKNLPGGIRNFLDIHNSLCNNLWLGSRFPFDELMENTIILSMDDIPIRVLDRPYALLHGALHRIANKPHGTQDRLIWLYDLKVLGDAMSDEEWGRFLTLTSKKQVSAIALDALTAMHELLDSKLSLSVLEALNRQAQVEPDTMGDLEKPWENYRRDFAEQRGLAAKFRYIRENLLPSPAYIRERYQPKSSLLIPYYYVKRVVDFARKTRS